MLIHKAEAVRKRLIAYDKMTMPLVDHYTQQGILKSFRGTESDVIYPQVKAHLDTLGVLK